MPEKPCYKLFSALTPVSEKQGEYTLAGKTYEFTEHSFAEISESEDYPNEYEICTRTKRIEMEKGKPETKRQIPTTGICVHIPEKIMRQWAKDIIKPPPC